MMKTDSIFLSIIVPAYNASGYLKRFFASLDAQITNNFELIIVNDGSTDDTYDLLLKRYSQNEKYNITVVDQENKGQNAARVFGLSFASGSYVWFVDIDDTIVPDATSCIEDMIKWGDNPDLVSFEMLQQLEKTSKPANHNGLYNCRTLITKNEKAQLICELIGGYRLNPLWKSVFDKALINSIVEKSLTSMPNLRYGEDFLLSCSAIMSANTIVYDPLPIYVYHLNPFSVMHERISDKMISDMNDVFGFKLSIVSQSNDDYSRELANWSGTTACSLTRRLLFYGSLSQKLTWIRFITSSDFFLYACSHSYRGKTYKQKIIFHLLAFLHYVMR